MMRKILIALFVIILLYLAICPLGPKNLDAETVQIIGKTPEQIYPYFIDFTTWPRWSKWITEEPEMKLIFGEPSSGEGASYSWQSKKSGNGKMRIVKCTANAAIDYELAFEGMGNTESTVRLKPVPGGTEIRWRIHSNQAFPFVLRGMMWFLSMDKKIQADFDEGIQNIAAMK